MDQHALVSNYFLAPRADRRAPPKLILEKPPSHDADSARRLLEALRRKNVGVRIAYTFSYCPWADELAKQLSDARNGPLEIDLAWSFLAHHYKHGLKTWKLLQAQGGGALRFYGIQFLGLLATFGRWDVDAAAIRRSDAPDEAEAFAATFRSGRITARIECDSRAQEAAQFLVRLKSETKTLFLFESDDPFSYGATVSLKALAQDRRVHALIALLRSLGEEDTGYWDSYLRSLDLWESCEKISASGSVSYASMHEKRST